MTLRVISPHSRGICALPSQYVMDFARKWFIFKLLKQGWLESSVTWVIVGWLLTDSFFKNLHNESRVMTLDLSILYQSARNLRMFEKAPSTRLCRFWRAKARTRGPTTAPWTTKDARLTTTKRSPPRGSTRWVRQRVNQGLANFLVVVQLIHRPTRTKLSWTTIWKLPSLCWPSLRIWPSLSVNRRNL